MSQHESHGHSTAAWTSVTILLLGFLVLAVAVGTASRPLGVIGGIMLVVGCVAGIVLAKAGKGVKKMAPPRAKDDAAYAADKR